MTVPRRGGASPERIIPVKALNVEILRAQEDHGHHLQVDAIASDMSR